MKDAPELDAASLRQVEAADPTASTWLSANAGSGKTRVLTDRVARLLLAGTAPQNVLCLTYTKAAASEMQNRLFRRLGAWAMAGDDELSGTLARLGAGSAENPETLAEARRLFARAIETPGGLKIQTIHAFCAAILRRFPLEAGVSPGFREIDEPAAERLRAEVLGGLAAEAPDTLDAVAADIADEDFSGICNEILRRRDAFPDDPSWERACAPFGLDPEAGPDALRARALDGIGPETLRALAATLAGQSKTMQALGDLLSRIAADGLDAARFEALARACLYADTRQPKPGFLTKGARTALGADESLAERLADQVAAAEDGLRGHAAARRTLALHRFAARFLPAYDAAKAERGLLDFDDLIRRTDRLLAAPGISEWVLYKLDGGIEHILVDEAQDTGPEQWRVIDRLTQDFASGESGHRPGERTIFVVGDLKQSIYSFQGADPESFAAMRQTIGRRLGHVGARLIELELAHSFRSAPEILRAVDATFPKGNRDGLGDDVAHLAFHEDRPGRVDLWPRVEKAEGEEDGPWWQPVDRVGAEHHAARLSRQVAETARGMVDHGRLTGADGAPRNITAGDILILVQSRGTLFHEIIRASKAAGLDVAGADVLKLGEELAVRDVTALLAFLDTPEDSLSLAAALRSPLFGWSEGALYDLAAGRSGRHLWEALRSRATDFPETHAVLRDLRDAADFLRPFELIERILTGHDGRRKLIARLGPEAADGIDALLARALAHERTEVPSLTGFLAAQEGAEAEIKRQAEGRGAKLRVMTVHGAKGLESPIVILPDTAEKRRMREVSDRVLVDGAGRALWSTRKAEAPRALADLRDAAAARRAAESRRLLYVAMTRAEQWLVVAAAGDLGRTGDTWYEQVAAGLDRAGAVAEPALGPGGLRLESPRFPATADAAPPARAPGAGIAALPAWARAHASAPVRPPRPVAPTDLGGAKALAGEGLPEAEALARGTRLHLLLEHLPGHPPERWPEIAAALTAPDPCPSDELAEARAALEAAETRALWQPGALAEVPVSATLPELGRLRVHGTIDRLLVDPDRVYAVDIKTNRTLPDRPEEVPEGILRQLGAYAAALAQVYPDRRIETAILWTAGPTLMPLPEPVTSAALARAHEAVRDGAPRAPAS